MREPNRRLMAWFEEDLGIWVSQTAQESMVRPCERSQDALESPPKPMNE